jgi:polyphosphate kinase 2
MSNKKDEQVSYDDALRELQILLVVVQRHIIEHGQRILVIFEGRDAAGKDSTIKRIVEHMSPRDTRVVAPSKPSDREQGQWYFQRFIPHLPSAGEVVLFNRSWYNRAGVEKIMGYCTEREYQAFMHGVVEFERMLVDADIQLIKYYLDIDHDEQQKRLEERRIDPLKQWKSSPIDDVALQHWDDYSEARNAMLKHTSHKAAPWIVVDANDKKEARLNVIRDLLQRIECSDRAEQWPKPDRHTVFEYSPRRHKRLAQ